MEPARKIIEKGEGEQIPKTHLHSTRPLEEVGRKVKKAPIRAVRTEGGGSHWGPRDNASLPNIFCAYYVGGTERSRL